MISETYLRIWHLVHVLISHVHLEGVDTWHEWKQRMYSQRQDKFCECSQNNESWNIINKIKIKTNFKLQKLIYGLAWHTQHSEHVYVQQLSQALQLYFISEGNWSHKQLPWLGHCTILWLPQKKSDFLLKTDYKQTLNTATMTVPWWEQWLSGEPSP